MHKEGVKNFPYYVGIDSLEEVATKEDRVCVLNILGTESRTVTPVSHAFSGGNVVFGTSPGRSGQVLETPTGDIPVYNSVKEGLDAGHRFTTAVVYLPPAGVKDGVAEVVKFNPELKKIIIITEKIPIHDARIIRAICQTNGVDVFGGNCLGVADSWNRVRIGGALGGSRPEESLVKGSVAIYSNSGNFTTTIAVYLLTKGWGTTTSISSGKDVYIHFAPREFFHALSNDPRSKCAVIYVEPGGYYEKDLNITRPTVACVVGRWKARLTKACGHAGSLAGSGDDARAKERWFMDYFGVDDIYTPENPVFSKKGAVVTNIAHIPEALTKVMELNGIEPDFEPRGDLSLKCWFANNASIQVPRELDIQTVRAISPYGEQIEEILKQVGAQYPRQSMKDASGASMMDPTTQITKLHGVSILDAGKHSFEENLVLSVIKNYPDSYERELANTVLNGFVNSCNLPELLCADAARKEGNSPNTVLTSAISIVGRARVKDAQRIMEIIFDNFKLVVKDPAEPLDYKEIIDGLSDDDRVLFRASDGEDRVLRAMVDKVDGAGRSSVFVDFVRDVARGLPSRAALLAAVWATLAWKPLLRKDISRVTFVTLPWYSLLFSKMIACSVPAERHTEDAFCGVKDTELTGEWSFTETAFLALVGRRPTEEELFEFSLLLGLIVSNGPGTISAQGSKGAVSADGPEDPIRVQINKAFAGFLTHTGFAHGGNGYEAIEFLIERFRNTGLEDPGSAEHGLDLKKIADEYATWYGQYKTEQKAIGNIEYKKIPCVGHPVFKGKQVNYDPRERFIEEVFKERRIYNVFLDFYRTLVQSLFEARVTRNVFCVNVDAVIAVILLKMVWNTFTSGRMTEKEVENAAFTTFLFGRMVGCAAEIDDHINRGRDMDTRTPASRCTFIR